MKKFIAIVLVILCSAVTQAGVGTGFLKSISQSIENIKLRNVALDAVDVVGNKGLGAISEVAQSKGGLHAISGDAEDILWALVNSPKDIPAGVVKSLIEAGVDVNAKSTDKLRDGISLLSQAIKLGHTGAARELIEAGADVNATDLLGRTPLMEAAISGDVETARLLLRYDADIDGIDYIGHTALYYAASSRKAKVAKFLADSGADIELTSPDRDAPLKVARDNGFDEIEEALLEVIRARHKERHIQH